MFYDKESDFEDDLVAVLKRHGWTDGVLEYPTEQDLIDNWANILFDNNKGIDRLNGQRLTKGEMAQILEQIETLRTPLALNSFINGKTVSIKRDNPADTAHFGKEISLKIYDRQEIAAGQSRYQIARQPMYPAKNKMLNDRRRRRLPAHQRHAGHPYRTEEKRHSHKPGHQSNRQIRA